MIPTKILKYQSFKLKLVIPTKAGIHLAHLWMPVQTAGTMIEKIWGWWRRRADQLAPMICFKKINADAVEPGDDAKPEAVRFVEQLRETETARHQKDRYKHIPPLPVVFYSGKQYSKLLDYTQSVRGSEPIVVVAQGLETFLIDVLRILSQVRSEPSEIVVGPGPADNNGA